MEQYPEDQLKAELAELRQRLAVASRQLAELETTDAQQERAQREARISARQWQATFDTIHDPVFLLDAGGTIVRCNQALVDFLAEPGSAIIGRRCRDVIHKATGSVEGCPYERAMETLERETAVWQLDERWFEATVDPMLDEDGYLIGFVHILEDITGRKREEQARRRRNLELGLLHRAGQAFSSTLDLEKLLATVLEEVRRALDVDGCSIWLSDPQTDELVCQGAAGLGSEIVQGWRLAPGEGFVGWVAGQGKSLIVPDARDDERHFKGVDVETGLEVRSVLAVPMRVKDQVIGTLEAVDAEVGRLDARDRRLLEPLAASAAIAIQNARLYEAAEAEISERKRAEAALRESEEHYRVLFEHLPIPVFTKNRQGEYTSCNAENQRYWAVNPVGRTDAELLAPGAAAALREIDLRVMETGDALTVEEHLTDTPLGARQVLSRKVPLLDASGNIVGILGASIDITETKRAEEALRESEERYSKAFRSSPQGVLISRLADGQFVEVNKAVEQLSGYSREDLIGHTSLDLGLVNPEDRESVKRMLEEHGSFRDFEASFYTKSGEGRVGSFSGEIIEIGGETCTIQVLNDITERKRATEALRRRAEELAALQATVLDITARHDLPTLLQTIVERATQLLNGLSGGMYLCDPDREEARCVVSYNTPDDYTGTVLKYGEGAAGRVAQTGEPLIIDDYRTWSGRAAVYEEEQPFTAMLSAPMILQGQVTGVIHVLQDVETRRFTETELDLLMMFASHAALAVENARLLEQARKEIAERKQVEEALRESQERFKSLVETMNEGLSVLDETGHFSYVNDMFCEMLGYSRDELIGSYHLGVVADEYRGRHREILGERMEGKSEVYETVLKRKDGEKLPVILAGSPLFDRDGNYRGAIGAATDITERRQAEEALRESEEKYRLTSENIPVVVYSALPDEHSTNIFLSGRARELTGYSAEEFLEDPGLWASIVHPEDEADVWERINDHRCDKTTLDVEYRIITRDGVTKWIRDKAKPALDENGEIVRIDGFVEDITERKQAEEALRRREQEIRLIADNAPALVSYVDAEGCYRFVNKQYEEWFDIPRLQIIGEHYREVLGEAAYEAIRERVGTVLSGQRVRYEEALPYMRGGPRWVIAEYVPDVDEQGHVNGFFALVTDITERKRAEQALREQTAELARSNALIAALSQVAAHLQTNLDPDQVMEILGTELERLGVKCIVALLDPDDQTAVVRYLSTESSVLPMIEKLIGRKLRGLRVTRLPIYEELVEQGRAIFVPTVMPLAAAALPGVSRPALKRAIRMVGIGPDTPAFCIPLSVEGRVFGVLNMVGEDLREDDLAAVSIFAGQAAIALENARLYAAEHATREQLRNLASYLQEAREEERKRIAREIHDELGQSLTALKFDISRLAERLPEEEPALRERVAAMATLIDGSIHTVQRVSTELRPGLLDDLGLAAAIEWQVEEFAERTGIRFDLHLGDDDMLESHVAIALFRILQETLTNVARHAGANKVHVELAVDPREVMLRVRDDGRGITESEISSTQALGLLGMRERARTLGGEVTFEGVRGQGTTVTVRIPCDLSRMTRIDESEA